MSKIKNKAKKILEENSIQPVSIEKISEEAGRMKNIFRVQTEDRGAIGVYLYKQPEGGERGRTIKQRLTAEKYTFNQIRTKTSLRAPEIITSNNQDYIICNWLEGENTGFKIEENERKQEMAKVLGESLSEIHSIQYRKFGELNQNGIEKTYDGWTEFLANLIQFLKNFNTPDIADKGIKYLEDNLERIEGDYQPVLIHGDYHAWNTVINENDKLGVLDCEASFVGCREYEITRAIEHWTDEYSISEAFIKAYGKDKLKDDWRDRKDYYEVLHATIGLIDGIRLGSEELMRMNKEGLEKQLKQQ